MTDILINNAIAQFCFKHYNFNVDDQINIIYNKYIVYII